MGGLSSKVFSGRLSPNYTSKEEFWFTMELFLKRKEMTKQCFIEIIQVVCSNERYKEYISMITVDYLSQLGFHEKTAVNEELACKIIEEVLITDARYYLLPEILRLFSPSLDKNKVNYTIFYQRYCYWVQWQFRQYGIEHRLKSIKSGGWCSTETC